MTAALRGQVWAVDFEPQTHREEPGKRERPALVIQSDALNRAGHATTIVIPGTSRIAALPPEDRFPLRIRIPRIGELKYDTDLLVDQIRAVANSRMLYLCCVVTATHLKKVEDALRLLTGR